jgi:thiol:disulfide interchange protein DsbD
MKRLHPLRWLVCAAVMGAAAVAYAQKPASVVSAKLLLATTAVRPGETAKLAAVAEIASGFHINDHHPSEDYLIPTELKLNPSDQLSVDKLVYPKGEAVKFPFSDTPLSVYQGTLTVGALLKFSPSMPAGDFTLSGKFSYQACNDHECLPPTNVPVSITVKVVKSGAPVKAANREVFSHLKFN